MDKKLSESKSHGRSQEQKQSATNLTVQKDRVKTILTRLRRKRIVLLGWVLLGIILLAVSCLTLGVTLNKTKKTVIASQNDIHSALGGSANKIIFTKRYDRSLLDRQKLFWTKQEMDENEQERVRLLEKKYLAIQQETNLKIHTVEMSTRDKKQRLGRECIIAVLMFYIGFWTIISGFGKLGAIKRYKNKLIKNPTVFDTNTAKHFLSGKFIWTGILLLFFSAIVISFSVDHIIDNTGKTFLEDSPCRIMGFEKVMSMDDYFMEYVSSESICPRKTILLFDNLSTMFFVKASAGIFLLLISAFLLYTDYKLTRPSINLEYPEQVHLSRKKSQTYLSLQKAKQKRVLHLIAGLLVIILLGGTSYMGWHGYDKRVRTVEKDLMLSQLYLLYDSIPIEVQDSDAIKRCNNNILQLIDLSKIIIRYLDENEKYWGDEYIITRNDIILGPLAKIFSFEYELFKISLEDKRVEIENHSNFMEESILFDKMIILGFIKQNLTQMWINPHYVKVKMPKDLLLNSKLEKYSAHGWPVVKTIDNLRMEFSYSYGSIQKKENISDEIHSSFPNPLVKEKLSIPLR